MPGRAAAEIKQRRQKLYDVSCVSKMQTGRHTGRHNERDNARGAGRGGGLSVRKKALRVCLNVGVCVCVRLCFCHFWL